MVCADSSKESLQKNARISFGTLRYAGYLPIRLLTDSSLEGQLREKGVEPKGGFQLHMHFTSKKLSKNSSEVGDKLQEPVPQGLKPSHVFSHLRHD
jgi:hypothetical protein